jgi:hypothetical protein
MAYVVTDYEIYMFGRYRYVFRLEKNENTIGYTVGNMIHLYFPVEDAQKIRIFLDTMTQKIMAESCELREFDCLYNPNIVHNAKSHVFCDGKFKSYFNSLTELGAL